MSWKINAKGGTFRYGAPYPMKTRVQVILTYVNTGSIATTARREKVSYNFVSKLVTQFQRHVRFGSHSFMNRGINRIPIWMKTYIEALIIIYPSLYIQECIQILVDEFNLLPNDTPSPSAIRKLLQQLHITRKKCIHVARERYSPYVMQRRQDYIRWRTSIDPSRMYFFDETGFNSETDQRTYGRTESGFPVASYRSKNPATAKYSVIGLCGYNEGFIQAIPIEGNFNTILVNDVVEFQLLPLLPRNTFLICDNASIHNDVHLARILSGKNITLVKLPVYSYDLNPIEMAFGLAKCYARQTPGDLEENPMLAILNAFLKINNLTIKRFYRKAWKIAR